jgi:two-component system, cell cycle sensor histidine kinase and response regulator CckA
MGEPLQQTILIVEDDPGVASLEKRRLERARFSVVTAANPAEAMQRLRQHHIALMLIDYRLPGEIDGLTFYDQVKAAGYDLPVILVTGFGSEATAIRALRGGVRDFVIKSQEYLDYLPDAVERVLRQVQMEHRLAESEARLAGIIGSAKDAILVAESDQRITLFNAAAERMFGCPAARALGQHISRFIVKDIHELNDDAASGNGSLTARVRAGTRGVRPGGESFPIEASMSRVEVHGRKFYTIVVRDITERKRAEEQLRLLGAAVHQAHESIMITSAELAPPGPRIVFTNPAFTRLTGYAAAEVLGRSPGILNGTRTDRGVIENFEKHLSLGRPFTGEAIKYRKDGSQFIMEWHTVPLRDEDGGISHFVSIQRDISARKQAEEQIREQAALLAKAQDAIMVRDIRDRIIFWNPRAERLYGWTAAEALGRNANELLSKPGLGPELDEARQAVMATGEWIGELREVARNGREVIVESRWTLVRDPEGNPKAKLVINTDITERKRLEAQLFQARRMESIGALAGGVAHDFNNLLTVITGFSEILLARVTEDDPMRQPLNEIRKAGERAASLTRQLLAFSRRQILAPRVFDLNSLINETERMLRRLIGEDIDLALGLDPALGRVKADPGQIEQVLLNLVVNARDAMPRGGHLTIETKNVELDEIYARQHPDVRPGPYVLVAVSDSGCGMDETTQAQIFEPFFTTKEQGKGTGLGLAMAYGIVKQSGGQIEVYSEIGHGSTFKIYLPRVQEEMAAKEAAWLAVSPQGTETVLLVEDEEGVRSTVRLALATNGYTVLEAEDAKKALEISEQHDGPIHLLITDVVMPKISGRQLADQMQGPRPGMKVLYVSGYTDDAIIRHGVLQAGVAFLQKPFTPTALARKVREILNG